MSNLVDKEPERYYDWMLWKMRQEDDMEDPVDDVTTYNNLRGWTTSTSTVTREDLLKKDISEMQYQVHNLQMRVKELTEELDRLRK
tara:strand:- start:1329 stop:1586 length:258 start_codon:yes stop_codon:yes gene_type:complete